MNHKTILTVSAAIAIASCAAIGGHWLWKNFQSVTPKSENTAVSTVHSQEKKHKKRVTSGERIDIVQKGGPYAVNVEISAQGHHCNVSVNGARVETRAHQRHPNRNIRKVK